MSHRKSNLTRWSLLCVVATSAHAEVVTSPQSFDNESIEEVTVTATRRDKAIHEVPLSVSVYSHQSLRDSGVTDLRSFNQLSSSVLISTTGSESNAAARIRGVGTVGENIGVESSVGLFVDGVYRPRIGILSGELGDIQQIEVLRGPQGTLFGRNTSAGLINIVTAPPSDEFKAEVAATVGNYNLSKFDGSVNGGLSETVAGRLEASIVRRDGFYDDVNTGIDYNDRDRYLVRGQFLYTPADDITLRVIGDYSSRDEACCTAVFANDDVSNRVDISDGASAGGPIVLGSNSDLLNPLINPRLGILSLVSNLPISDIAPSLNDSYDRNVAIDPEYPHVETADEWGLSAELNWVFDDIKFTSITAHRDFLGANGGDADFQIVDLLNIDVDSSERSFESFSQEFRLQGLAFNDRLDWLVGAYYAGEELGQSSSLRFGSDYGTFTSCFLAIGLEQALQVPGLSDVSQPGCLSPTGQFVIGSASPETLLAFNLLGSISNLGDEPGTEFTQKTDTFSVFTHNIFSLTNSVDITLGLRYTSDEKSIDANINNSNTVCPQLRALAPSVLDPLLAGAFIQFGCQGNSTSELNGLDISDEITDEEISGKLALSWRPDDHWLLFTSYARGYKAGGYNLDRSVLNGSNSVPSEENIVNLRFAPETVDAYEIGAKFNGARLAGGVTLFRQTIDNFQLNTFDGTRFLFATINSCEQGLQGADEDGDASTGACNSSLTYGVISEGVELEASFAAASNLQVNAGVTYADTHYNDDLVAGEEGSALEVGLRRLPNSQLSNAPLLTATASLRWTPQISNNFGGLVYISARYSDDYNTGSNLAEHKAQESYTLVDARLGLFDKRSQWSAELWAKNIFDTDYAQVVFDTAFLGSNSAYLADPRTFGLTVRKSF